MVARATDACHRLALCFVRWPVDTLCSQVRVAPDRVEGCAQVVRHRRQELALGLVRPFGFGPCRGDLQACAHLPRDVDGVHENTEGLPTRVLEWLIHEIDVQLLW